MYQIFQKKRNPDAPVRLLFVLQVATWAGKSLRFARIINAEVTQEPLFGFQIGGGKKVIYCLFHLLSSFLNLLGCYGYYVLQVTAWAGKSLCFAWMINVKEMLEPEPLLGFQIWRGGRDRNILSTSVSVLFFQPTYSGGPGARSAPPHPPPTPSYDEVTNASESEIEIERQRTVVHTLCCISLRRCYFGLETRVIIKIESPPFYPIKFDWFSWGWRKKIG